MRRRVLMVKINRGTFSTPLFLQALVAAMDVGTLHLD
jgi:hypothetical protein